MTKLYSLLMVLLTASISYACQEPYEPQGKLPEDFKFQICEQEDQECINRRISFMQKFLEYQERNGTTPVSQRSERRYLASQEIQPTYLNVPTHINVTIPDDMEYKTVHKGNVVDIIVSHKSSKK
jgi:hypothetical protein